MIQKEILSLKKELALNELNLIKLFLKKRDSQSYLAAHSLLVDQILNKLWQSLEFEDEASLVACGGYGRQELFPFSDVDLLLLIPKKVNHSLNQKIEQFITLAWDIGLRISHSVRNLDDTKREIKNDITVHTNLLESRYLDGDKTLYKHLKVIIHDSINPTQFYEAKLKEQDHRHLKYNQSAYQLEPNIKESPGGLRDLQMIQWIGKSSISKFSIGHLKQKKYLDTKNYQKLIKADHFFKSLRILLHITAQQSEDRLLFDYQNQLALLLKYKKTTHKKRSELLMRDVYESINFITFTNEVLLKKLNPKKIQKISQIPDSKFLINMNGWLEISPRFIGRDITPFIFDVFITFQRYNKLKTLGPNLMTLLNNAANKINPSFRKDKQQQDKFLSILKSNDKVNRSLRIMNKCNLIGAYIPAFGKIVSQMQHDLFHIYTVDEHILNVIRNLRRFSKVELKHEFPDCYDLFKDYTHKHVLYLAALFHDIAKGRGGDHSELGAKDVDAFSKLNHLSAHDQSLIKWLVKSHLIMSHTAQKLDLSDPKVIQVFAEKVMNKENLTSLYLLTVADIRATSPHVWNQWKATLLKNLFQYTLKYLEEDNRSHADLITKRKAKAASILETYNIGGHHYKTLWKSFGEDYFYKYTEEEIAWQTRLLFSHTAPTKPIIRVRHRPNGEGIEVLIYKKNTALIFNKTCRFFDEIGYNVAAAKIFTTQHDYALNLFDLLDANPKSVSYEGLFKFMEKELTSRFENPKESKAVKLSERSRQATHHTFDTKISILQIEQSPIYQLEIITDDRNGLLSLISEELSKEEISINHAKINTLGSRAEDTFLINYKNHLKMNEKKISNLIKKLNAAIA
ncbi:bifunctional uridylyltransferase/uridylyl-removing enzyme [Methylophilaceae bacterium]|nr:bifunctional uridylyltransferase/uridylyl-removing enzyme [Methylophilaceae bacterium]